MKKIDVKKSKQTTDSHKSVSVQTAKKKERFASIKESLSTPWGLRLRKVLSLTVIAVCLYLLIAPIYPDLEYRLDKYFNKDKKETVKIVRDSGGQESYSIETTSAKDKIKGDMVVIPKIGVAMEIGLGEDERVLDEGKSWLRPNGSTPDKGSNTVLTAHRFQYLVGKNTFYNLDKLENGDLIQVYWKDKLYEYTVNKSFVVTPDKIEVEAASAEPMLTLYTCTPVFTATNRLVVTALPKVD